jgi:hypothetical protein
MSPLALDLSLLALCKHPQLRPTRSLPAQLSPPPGGEKAPSTGSDSGDANEKGVKPLSALNVSFGPPPTASRCLVPADGTCCVLRTLRTRRLRRESVYLYVQQRISY